MVPEQAAKGGEKWGLTDKSKKKNRKETITHSTSDTPAGKPPLIIACVQVSKSWNRLFLNNGIWKSKRALLKSAAASDRKENEWLEAIKRKKLLRKNWKNGCYVSTKLHGHSDA